MPSDCFLHQVIQSKLGLRFLRLMLVAAATNVIFEPFLWLVLNRSGKACLTLPCIRVVVCSKAFLCKSVNINFCIKFILSKFQNFIKISKIIFLGSSIKPIW